MVATLSLYANLYKSNQALLPFPSRKRKPLSPKHNSSASAPTPPHPPPPARCSAAAAAPPSAFAPSSAAALIRPSKRPRKVSPHPAGAGELALETGTQRLHFVDSGFVVVPMRDRWEANCKLLERANGCLHYCRQVQTSADALCRHQTDTLVGQCTGWI